MRATVDEDRCRGHGICCTIAPDVFAISDEGYAEVLASDVPPAAAASVADAAESCPERAITVD